jgi:hypothetical protein
MSILSSTNSGIFKPLNPETIVKDLGLSYLASIRNIPHPEKGIVMCECYSFDQERYKWGQYIRRVFGEDGQEIYEANFILNGLHFLIKLNTYFDALMIVDYWKPESPENINYKANKLRTIVKTLL